MAEIYRGWQGALLYKAEVTAGLPVVPDTNFGYPQSFNMNDAAGVTRRRSIGTHSTVGFDEGVMDAGGSAEVFPVSAVVATLGKRTAGVLPSSTIHGNVGDTGLNHTGAKISRIRGAIDPGGLHTLSLDWMALQSIDNARIAPVVPTSEVFDWYEGAHSLTGEVAGIEFVIDHNLGREPIVAGAATTLPVAGYKRPAYRIKEGVEDITLTLRFFARPALPVNIDVIAALASVTLIFTGPIIATTSDVLTYTFANGKPNTRNLEVSGPDANGLWPVEILFKTWDVGFVAGV